METIELKVEGMDCDGVARLFAPFL